jgi:hypothetical protein
MKLSMIIAALLATLNSSFAIDSQDLPGSWQNKGGIVLFSENYFVFTSFRDTIFNYTYGGSWHINDNDLVIHYEFHTENPEKVGTSSTWKVTVDENKLEFRGDSYLKIDDGTPGALFGAWLFHNRIRDGKAGTPRSGENPRKTMKILTGTWFQWIAYNTETAEFFGTGGGTYTTVNGKYTENIDFFSRDSSRIGASLEFDYSVKGDEWHHTGLNSRGSPMYEIWKLRK